MTDRTQSFRRSKQRRPSLQLRGEDLHVEFSVLAPDGGGSAPGAGDTSASSRLLMAVRDAAVFERENPIDPSQEKAVNQPSAALAVSRSGTAGKTVGRVAAAGSMPASQGTLVMLQVPPPNEAIWDLSRPYISATTASIDLAAAKRAAEADVYGPGGAPGSEGSDG